MSETVSWILYGLIQANGNALASKLRWDDFPP